MTSGMAIEENPSMSSTMTANRGDAAEPQEGNDASRMSGVGQLDSGNEISRGIRPKPQPIRSESRDTSICSRNGRDSLRRSVSMRSTTFTDSERLYLEQLTIEGTDDQIESALRAIEDEELFFNHNSTILVQHENEEEVGLNMSMENGENMDGGDDATRDGTATSLATSDRRRIYKAATSSLTSTSRFDNSIGDDASFVSVTSDAPIPTTVMGSQRRREVLERRKSESSLNLANLWRAHQSGLAVTSNGSRRSLLRRESSISSIGSNMSGLSVLFGNRPHPGAAQKDVFRSSDDKRDENKSISSFCTPTKGRRTKQIRGLPPVTRQSPFRRSKSVTLSMLSPQRSLPKIPEPKTLDPRAMSPSHRRVRSSLTSSGRRKSVTFHPLDEELEFDKHKEAKNVTANDAVDTAPKRKQIVRRVVSDSQIAMPSEFNNVGILEEQDITDDQRKQMMKRDSSTSSIPSIHHGTPIRQDSMSSIPSLHHGNPLRDSMSMIGRRDSTSSIPSLHHGNPLRDSMSTMRQGSISSFASIRHGNPLRDSLSVAGRRSSTTSIPSLHHGRPIRDSVSTVPQDSIGSFASLHHPNPISQDSVSSFPSLHHGRPIRQDSIASIPPNAMTQEDIVNQFGVSEEVASAWMQLQSSETTLEDSERRLSALTTSTTNVEDLSVLPSTKNQETAIQKGTSRPKPVFLRQASRNVYEGEGVEVEQIPEGPIMDGTLSDTDSYYYEYRPDQTVFRTMGFFPTDGTIRTAGSFDDASIFSSFGKQQRTSDVFRDIRRSLSDDNLSTLSNLVDQNREFLLQIPNSEGLSDDYGDDISDGGSTSWEMEYASPNGRFDVWNILQDDYMNGYGGAGTLGFRILGTSHDDEACKPHVLSPPLMESIQEFLPPTKSGENFYLKYSMIRDGASLQTLLRKARGVQYSILAVETVDGEVFGSFTCQAWRKSWNYFGTGESFLWRMRNSRLDKTNGILEQAQKESEIDVYPYTGENGFIQLCTHDRIAVGGGIPEASDTAEKKSDALPNVDNSHEWGFGLSLQADLLQGTSSPCVTFGSPSLSKSEPSGSLFEVMNVELWTTTPCMTEEDAEKLDLGKLFLGPNVSIKNGPDARAYAYSYSPYQ